MYSSVAYDMVSCDFKQRSDVPNQTEAGVSASSSAVVRSALPTSFWLFGRHHPTSRREYRELKP